MSYDPNMNQQGDELFDVLNLSPPMDLQNNNMDQAFEGHMTRPTIMAEDERNHESDPYMGNVYGDMVANTSHSGAFSTQFQNNANLNLSDRVGVSVDSNNMQGIEGSHGDTNGLLNPKNSRNVSGYDNQKFLSPRSPGMHSNLSVYSDISSNPGSPFVDAVSYFSGHGEEDPSSLHLTKDTQYFDVNTQNMHNFDSEIELGGSVSTTNLTGLHQQVRLQQHKSFEDSGLTDEGFGAYNGDISNGFEPTPFSHSDKLTENNLINYNNSIDQKEVTISIQQAPEEVAAKTPSLFSNSSANSSVHNSPRSNVKSEKLTPVYGSGGLTPNSQIFPSSPGSVVSDASDANSLLRPEEFQSIRRGRKKSHSQKPSSASGSRSSSRSPADDDDTSPTPSISNREKMLELASPNQSSKRTQKHPSVYACHLCDKRFTRPYNLKSHLRTHTDERPFICNVCGKAFARQHDRKRHEDLHTGEKKFQCKGFLKNGTPYGCGRKFARADALRRHFQTEAGKECIRLLIEEDEKERIKNENSGNITGPSTSQSENSNDYLSPNSAHLLKSGSSHSIPSVAISPPD